MQSTQKKPRGQPKEQSNHTAIVHPPTPPAPKKGCRIVGVFK